MGNNGIGNDDNVQFKSENQYLNEFEAWLSINIFAYDLLIDYLDCIETFLHQFFDYAGISNVRESVGHVYDYLNDWLPKNQTCNTRTLKLHMNALKHFYNYLKDEGAIEESQFEEVRSIIESSQQRWLARW